MPTSLHAIAAEALSALHVPAAPPSFVSAAWSNALCDIARHAEEPWPFDTDVSTTRDACKQLADAISNWPHQDDGSNTNDTFWIFMAENSCSPRALLAVLAYHIDAKEGCQWNAALVYLSLLQLSGASAHKIYSPMLFRRTCQCIKQSLPGEHQDDDEDDSVVTDTSDAAQHLLFELVRCIASPIFRSMTDSTDIVVETLAQASRLSCSQPRLTQDMLLSITAKSLLPVIAYAGLHRMSKATDNADNTTRRVFKTLLNTLNMTSLSQKATSFTQDQLRVRNLALSFLEVLKVDCDASLANYWRILAQHLCTTVPDKSAHRAAGAEAFAAVIKMMSPAEAMSLLTWLHHFSRSGKTSQRTVALEYVSVLLVDGPWWSEMEKHLNTAPSSTSEPAFSPPGSPASTSSRSPLRDIQNKLVQLIFLRCSDKAVNVRIKALKCLALVASQSEIEWLRAIILQLYRQSSLQDLATSTSRALDAAAQDGENTLPGIETPSKQRVAADKDTLSRLLQRRLADQKSMVRKAAVAATEAILLLLETLNPGEVQALTGRCRDPVLSVRKQALESSFNVLTVHRHSDVVRRAFFESILPLMLDNEETVRAKCGDIVQSILFEGLLEDDAELTNSLLDWLADHTEYRRYIQRGCAEWSRQGQISAKHAKALFARVDHGVTSAWTLLSIISSQCEKFIDASVVYKYWTESVLENTAVSCVILTTLTSVAQKLTSGQRSALSNQLKDHVTAFALQPALIAVAMTTVMKFDALDESAKEGLADKSVAFCRKLLGKCKDKLAAMGTGQQAGLVDELMAARYIFTLGEAAMLCPQSVDDVLILLLQGLVAQGENERSPILRAHGYLALGKVCLQREDLAKTWISSMAREVEECPDAAVRNNIAVVMADLCIRYTTFVERYIPTLATCLRDESPLVRRQALMLLTRLLTEDYIKLKGLLFFRLLYTLVDDDLQVRNLAHYCLIHMLYARDSTIFRAHFVESVYHFNDYRHHPTYNRLLQSDRDRARFNLTGIENRTKREYIYRIMLQHCTDVDRLNITQDLCQGVLNAVAEEEIELDGQIEGVLADALLILSSKDIKLGKTNAVSEEAEEEEVPSTKAAVKAQIISKIAKKNLVQNILPIVIQLKGLLDRRRSPLQKNVMLYLREVMLDYKDDVEELLSANQQLAREIKFDLEMFEKESKSRRVSVMSLAATPSRLSPRLRPASMAPSPFLVGMTTPNFKAPLLRGQTSSLRRQSRSAPAVVTPLRAGRAVSAHTPRPGDVRAAAPSTPLTQVNPLAWVRTPASKLRHQHSAKQPLSGKESGEAVQTQALPALAQDDTDVIILESPAQARSRRDEAKWPLPPPVFKSPVKTVETKPVFDADDDDEEDPLVADNSPQRKKKAKASA
eukprot:m.206659 g.206659  ORF g.206659 m.206659 type:complete len:1386 (+) comp16909_c2_seq12:62-4219(+)